MTTWNAALTKLPSTRRCRPAAAAPPWSRPNSSAARRSVSRREWPGGRGGGSGRGASGRGARESFLVHTSATLGKRPQPNRVLFPERRRTPVGCRARSVRCSKKVGVGPPTRALLDNFEETSGAEAAIADRRSTSRPDGECRPWMAEDLASTQPYLMHEDRDDRDCRLRRLAELHSSLQRGDRAHSDDGRRTANHSTRLRGWAKPLP